MRIISAMINASIAALAALMPLGGKFFGKWQRMHLQKLKEGAIICIYIYIQLFIYTFISIHIYIYHIDS